MSTNQRLLKRLSLQNNIAHILREAVYHKAHDEVEDSESGVLWREDEATPRRLKIY